MLILQAKHLVSYAPHSFRICGHKTKRSEHKTYIWNQVACCGCIENDRKSEVYACVEHKQLYRFFFAWKSWLEYSLTHSKALGLVSVRILIVFYILKLGKCQAIKYTIRNETTCHPWLNNIFYALPLTVRAEGNCATTRYRIIQKHIIFSVFSVPVINYHAHCYSNYWNEWSSDMEIFHNSEWLLAFLMKACSLSRLLNNLSNLANMKIICQNLHHKSWVKM